MASEAKEVNVAAPEAAPTVQPVVAETKAELAKEEAQAVNGNHAAVTDAVLEKDIEGQRYAPQKVCSVALQRPLD